MIWDFSSVSSVSGAFGAFLAVLVVIILSGLIVGAIRSAANRSSDD